MIEKKRDTSKKRNTILDAAMRVFIDEGYDGASMDRIADIAGASKRTVYNHFSSKEALFQAVLTRLISDIMALKQIPYSPKASLASQLEKFADAKIAFAEQKEWLGMFKVTAGVFARHPDLVRDTIQQTEDTDTLADWLTQATLDGRMAVPNPKLASAVFWYMVGGAFFWPAIFYGPLPPKDYAPLKKEMIQMFLNRYSIEVCRKQGASR